MTLYLNTKYMKISSKYMSKWLECNIAVNTLHVILYSCVPHYAKYLLILAHIHTPEYMQAVTIQYDALQFNSIP